MRRATFLVALVFLLLAGVVLAADGYDLSWWTVDGGGATFSTGGGYTLGGSVGQPDAGALSGGGYSLLGGFWLGAGAQYRLYLPVLLRNRSFGQ